MNIQVFEYNFNGDLAEKIPVDYADLRAGLLHIFFNNRK